MRTFLSVPLVVGVLMLASYFLAETAQGVRNGTATADLDKSVMALGYMESSNATSFWGASTVQNVQYARCMATAAHNLVDDDGAPIPSGLMRVLQGQNPLTTQSKLQEIERYTIYPDWQTMWTDLAVVWLKNQTGPGQFTGRPVLQDVSDYQPLEMASGDLGPYPTVTAEVLGYGAAVAPDGSDTPSGTKRKGTVIVNSRLIGTQETPQRPGSFFGVIAGSGNQIQCRGDSGGPLLKNGKTYGVTSVGLQLGQTCQDTVAVGVTAFAEETIQGVPSNNKWVKETAAKTCGKTVMVEFSSGGSGVNKVEGSLLSSIYMDEGVPSINNEIDCVDNAGVDGPDCSEMVHHNYQAAETLQLEAKPGAGQVFQSWFSPNLQAPCPCQGSPNAVCNLPYSSIGVYNATTSVDSAVCQPIFAPQGPTPPPQP